MRQLPQSPHNTGGYIGNDFMHKFPRGRNCITLFNQTAQKILDQLPVGYYTVHKHQLKRLFLAAVFLYLPVLSFYRSAAISFYLYYGRQSVNRVRRKGTAVCFTNDRSFYTFLRRKLINFNNRIVCGISESPPKS